MKPSRRRRATPAPEALECRCLLSQGGLSGSWIGQDQHDLVGHSRVLGPSDIQDIHVTVRGLPASRAVASGEVRGHGGGLWHYNGPPGSWAVALVRAPGATDAEVYFEPYQVETGRTFWIVLRYDDGTTAEVAVAGGVADPNLRVPEARVRVAWAGQDGRDWTGPGPAVGPDGVEDAHLVLTNLSSRSGVAAVSLTGPAGVAWQFGTNHQGDSNAALFVRADDPTAADLYINPDRDLRGQPLTLRVVYTNGRTDTADLVAGPTDPRLHRPTPAPVPVRADAVTVRWLGQDGQGIARPGDVRLALDGLPADRAVVGATLSDQVRGGSWAFRATGQTSYYAEPFTQPLAFRRAADPTKAELAFPPIRDETGATLILRLAFNDGTTALAPFLGGPSDPGLRAPGIAPSVVLARPGDDLNALANQFGTVRLSAGRYDLARPLVLDRPVTITADPGAMLVFTQGPTAAPWTATIKIHHGHTTLDGFAVRFTGPIRWDWTVNYDPAVIGTTDNRDPSPGGLKVALALTRLDLEAPPPSRAGELAPKLLRLVSAEGGVVAGNILKGGTTEFVKGPWQIVDNDYRGTVAGTYAYDAFAGHHTHDLVLRGNRLHPDGSAGRTWRFLVLTGSGSGDVIRDNTVAGIGPRDTDTEHRNAAEIVLTEAYRLHFEGRPAALSADGRILQVPAAQGEPAGAGSVVAVLSGPDAGQWRRVAQAIDPTTYLLDAPLPGGDYAVSITTGFVGETFRGNTIDTRGSSVAGNLILPGNHFGTQVLGNRLLGGGEALRITAAPTERPFEWGWSHGPSFGWVINGNVLVDSARGGTLAVEHGPAIKSNRGRLYFTAELTNNTVAWSDAFLARRAAPPAFTIGDLGSIDPGELVLRAHGNRVAAGAAGSSLRVHVATVNGRLAVEETIPLPVGGLAAPTGLALVSDTGVDASDGITSDGRLRFDAVPGASGYESRTGAAGAYRAIGPRPGEPFLPEGLEQGTNTVWVRAVDATGAHGPEVAITLVLDTIVPTVTGSVVLEDGPLQVQPAPNGVASVDQVGTSPPVPLGDATPFTPAGPAVGVNTDPVHAIDRAGNVGPDPTIIVRVAEPVGSSASATVTRAGNRGARSRPQRRTWGRKPPRPPHPHPVTPASVRLRGRVRQPRRGRR